jgi:2-polyprenyl-3-methyl-5-hydroxy-6-metoxy-1,4-benzoquinol methylase
MIKRGSWDPAWEEIHKSRKLGKYPPEELVRFVARKYYKVSSREAFRFFDLGCGLGAASWYLAREGFTVFGIDGSKSSIERVT